MGGLGGLGRLGQVGRVGQVRQVGQVGVRAARAENEKAGRAGESRCLYFGKGSLIVRLLFALPVSFLYRLYRVSGKRKKFY